MEPTPPTDAPHPGIDLADLKRKSVRGGVVTFASQGVTVAIQLASTVILARLLGPEDYGLMAMVVAVTAFAGLFRDLGLSSAAIQEENLTHAQQSNLFWINLALGLALTTIVAAASPLVAAFYGRPEVLWVTVALSFTFLVGSVSTQSGAWLVREMRFGRRAVATVAGAAVSLGVSVAFAVRGHRHWSLVWGQLAGALVTTVLLFALSPFRPGRYTRGAGLRGLLKFGANVTAFDLVNYFHRNLDNILIGRFWGTEALGIYSRAYSLLMFPIANLRGPINAVAFPAMSRLRNDPEALRRYYVKTTSLLAFPSMLLAAFVFVASKPLVNCLLGEKWNGVAPVFSYLALAALVQPVSGLAGTLLLSMGRDRCYLQCGIFNTAVFATGMCIGLWWGPEGVALAYALTNLIVLYPWLRWAFHDSPIAFRDFAGACAWPLGISLFAAITAGLWKPATTHLSPIVQVCSLFVVFSIGVFVSAVAARFWKSTSSAMCNRLIPTLPSQNECIHSRAHRSYGDQ